MKIELGIHQKEFMRFCIVGGVCTIIDSGLFYLLRSFYSYEIALIIGYIAGLAINYILTVYWTFSTRPSVYNVIGIVTAHIVNLFVVRMGLMELFVRVLGLNDNIAYLPVMIISVIANFCMVRFVVRK